MNAVQAGEYQFEDEFIAFIICPFSQSWQSRGEVNHPSVHVGVKQNPNCRGWRATPWGCLVRPAQPHLCSSDWTQGWAEPGPEQNEGPEVASVPHTLSPCLYHRETGICGEHFFQNTHTWLLPLRKEGVQRCAVVCGNYGPLMVKPTSSLSLFRMGLELWTQKGLVSQSSSPMDLFGPWWGGKKKKQNGRNVAGRTLREMTYFQVGLAACCRRQLCPGHTIRMHFRYHRQFRPMKRENVLGCANRSTGKAYVHCTVRVVGKREDFSWRCQRPHLQQLCCPAPGQKLTQKQSSALPAPKAQSWARGCK